MCTPFAKKVFLCVKQKEEGGTFDINKFGLQNCRKKLLLTDPSLRGKILRLPNGEKQLFDT